MTHLPHGKPLIHHITAIAMAIAAAFIVSVVFMQDAEAATVVQYACVNNR
jgi:hypothetical protein